MTHPHAAAAAHYGAMAAQAAQQAPLLIVKTVRGFALVKISPAALREMAIDVSSLECFSELEDTYSFRADGAMSAIKRHFTPAPPAVVSITDGEAA